MELATQIIRPEYEGEYHLTLDDPRSVRSRNSYSELSVAKLAVSSYLDLDSHHHDEQELNEAIDLDQAIKNTITLTHDRKVVVLNANQLKTFGIVIRNYHDEQTDLLKLIDNSMIGKQNSTISRINLAKTLTKKISDLLKK